MKPALDKKKDIYLDKCKRKVRVDKENYQSLRNNIYFNLKKSPDLLHKWMYE